MKIIFCYLLLILLIGCSSTNSSKNDEKKTSTEECTKQSSLELKQENVEEISLDNKPVNQSGRVSDKEYKGYIFKAEAGQKLSYKTDSDICIWVFAPDNELVNSTKLEKAGKYTIQIAAPKGSTTFDLEMSLETPTQTLSSPKPPDDYKTASKQVDLTQEQALEIVKGWYKAKPQIFGNSFDVNLVNEYTTGQLYYKTTQKDGGGSMGWLQRNGCYYTYPYSNIDNIWLFSTSGTRPLLKVKVSEKLQLNGSSSAGCSNRPKSYSKTISYWFEKENGTWKIYDYEVE